MKNNIKLFFSSLINNNTAIDAARKKPWYAAIILCFISLILSVIPTFSLELAKHADKKFASSSYSLREASTLFAKEMAKDSHKDEMYVIKNGKESTLANYQTVKYDYTINKVTFVFEGVDNAVVNTKRAQYNDLGYSYMLFTSDSVYMHIVDPNNTSSTKVDLYCLNAYKKIEKDDLKKAYVETGDATKDANQTWKNFKLLIRKLYNQTRTKTAGMQLLIISIVNVGIVLLMGFMIWVLTRGKNNPYRIFSVWECYKICFWAGFAPGLLTCGAGFLLRNFASTIFPLLLGVRVMWLSMKSLRPDGSGYAAN